MRRYGGGLALEMWRAEGDARASDAQLQERIWLEWRALGIGPGALMVEVHHGVATLGGTVRSYAAKVAAGDAAARVPLLRRIENVIAVDPLPANAWTDDTLLQMVTSVLRWDSRVPADRVSAEVVDGHVVLSGNVDRDDERAAAEAAVSGLVGVRGVINRITVPARSAGAQGRSGRATVARAG